MVSTQSSWATRKTAGTVMSVVGFLMILANALDYLLGWQGDFTPLWMMGLVVVVIGMHISRVS